MKRIGQLNMGFADAENYKRRENKALFNTIFFRNSYLDALLDQSRFFLIGEKGTGKTAYAVFLSNNDYKNTVSEIKYIRETDYQQFIFLKKEKHLQLSDYANIWKIIIMLLMSKAIDAKELDHSIFSKTTKMKALMAAIDEYHRNAFTPEILTALSWIENDKIAAEIVHKNFKLKGEEGASYTFNETRFQTNLSYIQSKFEEALSGLKLSKNRILFIDGIDIRPGSIPYDDYLECIKGLANAVWALNNDFFPQIRDSEGRLRVVLLIRPDIFNSLSLQNQSNKIRDNSVFLDWRTTYPSYRTSQLFFLADRLFSAQQREHHDVGYCWDQYFPWKVKSVFAEGDGDDSFISFLRISYSRPRDIVAAVQILKDQLVKKDHGELSAFVADEIESNEFRNAYSEYLMSGIKDQLAFYYSEKDYEMFLQFFSCFDGYFEFSYDEYRKAYSKFTDLILEKHNRIPEFVESEENFLQFLYDTNIISWVEETDQGSTFYRWCYRERAISNFFPKVKFGLKYRFHYGLLKALNLGYQRRKA